VTLSSDSQGNSSLTIDKGSAGTDTATGIKTLVLSSSQPNTVAIAGTPNFAGGLTIDGASGAQSGQRETIDFTLYSQALTMWDGNVPDIGVTFKNFNFGTLIGTAKGDTFNILDQASANGSNPGFERIDGGGGNDTFNVDYGSGGGAPLLLMGGTGSDDFEFKSAPNSSMSFVWGGGGDGKDVFDFSQSTTVIEINVQGLTKQSLFNLDTQKLQNDLSNLWYLPQNSVVIINPGANDKIEFQGKTISAPAYAKLGEWNSNWQGTVRRPFPDTGVVNVTETQSNAYFGFIGNGFEFDFDGENNAYNYNPDDAPSIPSYFGSAYIGSLGEYSTVDLGNGSSSGYPYSNALQLIGFVSGDFGINVSSDGPSFVYQRQSTSSDPSVVPNENFSATGNDILGSGFFAATPFQDPSSGANLTRPTFALADYAL
jgi:hypothetical protein